MSPVRKHRVKTYIFVFLLVLLGSVGNTILSKGMKNVGDVEISHFSALTASLLHIISSGTIWLGISCMLAFFICHMLVLSWADYSFVMPFRRWPMRWCRSSVFCFWATASPPRAGRRSW